MVGNDDLSAVDEDDDPYVAGQLVKGVIGEHDEPNIKLSESDGAVGDTVELNDQFIDFARLDIGGKWFIISDPAIWRFTGKLKKVDEAVVGDKNGNNNATEKLWIDDGSTAATDHAGW